ncbi:MAG: hypothetical protein HOO86_12715, partial [Bacteroidales bacterium]|nr:hypothetical protein [Bacteroidales bacterium]
ALKFIGFGFFIAGLIISIIQKNKKIVSIFVLSFLAFLIIVFKAGFTFSHHAYYVIPFVPVMALVCGFGISKIPNPTIILLALIVISLENVLNQQHDFRLKTKEIAIASLETTLDKFSVRNDLVVINSGEVPTPMYFAHRKGWLASNQQIQDEIYIHDIKEKGCKYVIILKQYFGTNIDLPYELMFSNEHYSVYKM